MAQSVAEVASHHIGTKHPLFMSKVTNRPKWHISDQADLGGAPTDRIVETSVSLQCKPFKESTHLK
ncbi:hypothetical protein JCGZ_09777 [Jatropha curcas]|uniref:Uncharacterized protein n=1 Tax=Jatropha curcas TaxID=180498 RepID=A0A067KJR4_JATCU|nr:hypothetical protein JCGZ_09777 [Jatropha curcas]